MKRRNAESGKLRRPINKRTKVSEATYENSLMYLRFVLIWAAVMLADYILEFRFEFLWPIWLMLKSIYDSFKYQGLAFSVFFICVAITSDVICFFFIPVQWIFVAASTYVWIQYVWFTVAEKGICLPTVIICCFLMYVEGSFRTAYRGGGLEGGGYELCKPFAAHCVGYPVVTFGFGVKAYVGGDRILVRRHSEASKDDKYSSCNGHGSPGPRRRRHEHSNGYNHHDHNHVHSKIEKTSHNNINSKHINLNGVANTMMDLIDEERRDASRGSTKSLKCEKKETNVLREERKKNKIKEKDKEVSDKSTEQSNETILREEKLDNTKVVKENGLIKDKEKDKERERETRECKEYHEELKRIRIELSSARAAEEDARKALSAAIGSEKQKRSEYNQLKMQHTALQQKVQTWRTGERASLERRLSEERRARSLAEQQLIRIQHHTQQRKCGECENEWCRTKRTTMEAESSTLRRDLVRAREHAAQLQRDLAQATEQIRSIENRSNESANSRLANAWTTLQERAAHLEHSLSAETRVKLDLLSALGEAKRQLHIREGTITQQEKEIDELKAQMLAVMPLDNCYHTNNGSITRLKLTDRSPLDPNASVYTPRQLCSDA